MWCADSEINNKISITIEEMSSKGLGVEGLKVDTEDDATVSIDTISAAIQKVSSQRSALGAVQNRLEHTIDNLDNVVENTTAAESVSVIQIWLKRWLTTARTTFLHRQVSLCLHRQTSLHRVLFFSVTVIIDTITQTTTKSLVASAVRLFCRWCARRRTFLSMKDMPSVIVEIQIFSCKISEISITNKRANFCVCFFLLYKNPRLRVGCPGFILITNLVTILVTD